MILLLKEIFSTLHNTKKLCSVTLDRGDSLNMHPNDLINMRVEIYTHKYEIYAIKIMDSTLIIKYP